MSNKDPQRKITPSGARSRLFRLAAWMARRLPGWAKRLIYRVGPLARLVRSELNRAAPAGMSVIQVAAGAIAGLELELDLHSEKDYWLGTYEIELQEALSRLVKPDMVAYDVGANIGYISLILASLVGPGGQVFTFEALPDNVSRLQKNLALNQMSDRVSVVPAAVIDRSRTASFLVGPSGGMGKAEGSAGRQDVAYHQTIQVGGLALDEFVYQQGNLPPQLVKMDIEGGEVLALPGMARLIQEARPLVLLELHGPEAARCAWESLKPAGYRICKMQSGFPEVAAWEALDWKAYLAAFPVEGG